MIFALVIERDPMRWQDFPAAFQYWIQVVGVAAAALMALYGIYYLIARPGPLGGLPASGSQKFLFRLCAVGAIAGLGISAFLSTFGSPTSTSGRRSTDALVGNAFYVGASCALAALILPILFDLARLRWRRIWALAKLSFKEAVRRRVLWVFSAIILIFMFASWFLESKPENQVRNYVWLVYWVTSILLLAAAGLIASFSIPADVKQQTIHTIVTKPVERFEIILGRFLGYMMLLTVVLVAMTGLSYLYVLREIDPDAQRESMRARVPLYGNLSYAKEAVNVGREWGYRGYIAGGGNSQDRAIWTYTNLPRHLAERKDSTIPCEFTFDIFRTYKGEEGKGVLCSFVFRTPQWDQSRASDYEQAKNKAREIARIADRRALIEQAYRDIRGRAPQPEEVSAFVSDKEAGAPQRLVDNLMSEEFGVHEVHHKVIVDYHTQGLDLPIGLFRSAFDNSRQASRARAEQPADLTVTVKCDSSAQYLGMAKYDFYLLDAERPFWFNFFKGAAGLWLRLCIVVGVSIALSTYLSGVIAWLATMWIYITGVYQDTLQSIVGGENIGGGPMEAFYRLANRENMAVPLDATPTRNLALTMDIGYRWVMRMFLNILPDVDRLDWTYYVADGFNISSMNTILLSALTVAGYLLPWAILAYYLMKSREVAA